MPPRRAKPSSKYALLNKVKLVKGGRDYFDCLQEIISSAQNTVHLQTYIFEADETGQQVGEALMAAAKRKVAVYVIVDGYASQSVPDSFIHQLKESGVNFRFFEPLFRGRLFYFGRRMHHKIVVADSRVAMVGGVNISNRYNDVGGQPAWLDFAIHVEGDIAKELCLLCRETWKGFHNVPELSCEKQVNFNFKEDETSAVRIRRNDWVRRKNQVSKTYINMLNNASSHITILCSYFLPGVIIKRHLKKAVKRGVKIKLIVAGKSDLALAKYAERYMYDWLLRNSIEIYEYQPSILHGKMAVCDDKWMTIGSYNINDISAYASIELNLDINDPAFTRLADQKMEEIILNKCVHITKEEHLQNKNLLVQFRRWSAYIIFRVLFYLFTFYFRQRG